MKKIGIHITRGVVLFYTILVASCSDKSPISGNSTFDLPSGSVELSKLTKLGRSDLLKFTPEPIHNDVKIHEAVDKIVKHHAEIPLSLESLPYGISYSKNISLFQIVREVPSMHFVFLDEDVSGLFVVYSFNSNLTNCLGRGIVGSKTEK